MSDLRLHLPDELIDEIANRAAARLAEDGVAHARTREEVSEFVTPKQAAELLCCRRQRIDDLLSQRRLSRLKEGGRTLLRRAEVLALVEVRSEARAGCQVDATPASGRSRSEVAP